MTSPPSTGSDSLTCPQCHKHVDPAAWVMHPRYCTAADPLEAKDQSSSRPSDSNPVAIPSPARHMGIPPYPTRNRQARSTIGILNAVRYGGTGLFILLAALFALMSVIGIVGSGGAIYGFSGFVAAVICALWAALVYAVVGWFVDSLALLIRIEENTRPLSDA